jgi:hypothetical protein
MPEKVDYTERVEQSNAREQNKPATTLTPSPSLSTPSLNKNKPATTQPAPLPQPQTGGDIFDMMDGPSPQLQPAVIQPAVVKPPAQTAPKESFEDIFFSDTRPTAPTVTPTQTIPGTLPLGQPQRPSAQTGGFDFNFLGGPAQTFPSVSPNAGINLLGGPVMSQPTVPPANTNFLDGNGLNFGISTAPPRQTPPPAQNIVGLNLLGGFSLPTTNSSPAMNLLGTIPSTNNQTPNIGFSLLGAQSTPAVNNNLIGVPTTASFRAYDNQHLEILMNCTK